MGGWMPNWLEIAGKHFFLTWVAQFAHKLLFVGVHKHKQVWNLISVSALPELCELCDPSKFSFLGAHSPALAEFLVLPAFCFICTTQNPWYAWQAQNPPTHPQTHKPDIHYFSPASPCISLMNFFAFTCLGVCWGGYLETDDQAPEKLNTIVTQHGWSSKNAQRSMLMLRITIIKLNRNLETEGYCSSVAQWKESDIRETQIQALETTHFWPIFSIHSKHIINYEKYSWFNSWTQLPKKARPITRKPNQWGQTSSSIS